MSRESGVKWSLHRNWYLLGTHESRFIFFNHFSSLSLSCRGNLKLKKENFAIYSFTTPPLHTEVTYASRAAEETQSTCHARASYDNYHRVTSAVKSTEVYGTWPKFWEEWPVKKNSESLWVKYTCPNNNKKSIHVDHVLFLFCDVVCLELGKSCL